jgi:hypothetical protein
MEQKGNLSGVASSLLSLSPGSAKGWRERKEGREERKGGRDIVPLSNVMMY